MQWEIGTMCCSYNPIQRGFIFFIIIAFIYVLAHLINNRVWFIFTRKGLNRIESKLKTKNGMEQPVRFKDIEFKKVGRFSILNAILSTFRDLEELKEKGNWLKLWELKTKSLKERIEVHFFKRNPFLVICVLTACLGVATFANDTMLTFQSMSISGSGGFAVIAGGLIDALKIQILASLTCAVSALGYLSAKKSAGKISTEITKLEIHLIGREKCSGI